MDIKKLEELSCLKIEVSQQHKMEQSLNSIVDMLHSIDSVNFSEKLQKEEEKSYLAEDTINDTYLVNNNNESYHTNEGLFLAPKVIHKD